MCENKVFITFSVKYDNLQRQLLKAEVPSPVPFIFF